MNKKELKGLFSMTIIVVSREANEMKVVLMRKLIDKGEHRFVKSQTVLLGSRRDKKLLERVELEKGIHTMSGVHEDAMIDNKTKED